MTADHAAIRARYPGKSSYSEAEFIAMGVLALTDMPALLAENEALLAVIDAAPHGFSLRDADFCRSLVGSDCDCWKARVRSDAQEMTS